MFTHQLIRGLRSVRYHICHLRRHQYRRHYLLLTFRNRRIRSLDSHCGNKHFAHCVHVFDIKIIEYCQQVIVISFNYFRQKCTVLSIVVINTKCRSRFSLHCSYCLELSEQLHCIDSGSLAVFQSRLKTFLFRRTFNPVYCARLFLSDSATEVFWHSGALQIGLLLLLLLTQL